MHRNFYPAFENWWRDKLVLDEEAFGQLCPFVGEIVQAQSLSLGADDLEAR